MLQQDRHADRGDERREPRRIAQRSVGDALDRIAERHAHGDRRERGEQEDERAWGAGQGNLQQAGRGERGERADHHHLAVGEVDEAEHAVDHGVAERDQRVDAAEHQAVENLLQQDLEVHGAH